MKVCKVSTVFSVVQGIQMDGNTNLINKTGITPIPDYPGAYETTVSDTDYFNGDFNTTTRKPITDFTGNKTDPTPLNDYNYDYEVTVSDTDYFNGDFNTTTRKPITDFTGNKTDPTPFNDYNIDYEVTVSDKDWFNGDFNTTTRKPITEAAKKTTTQSTMPPMVAVPNPFDLVRVDKYLKAGAFTRYEEANTKHRFVACRTRHAPDISSREYNRCHSMVEEKVSIYQWDSSSCTFECFGASQKMLNKLKKNSGRWTVKRTAYFATKNIFV